MADEEGFVRRWSRRKSAARDQGRAPEQTPSPHPERGKAAAPAAGAEGELPSTAARDQREPEPALDLEALPDIESLTYESDFTVFMRKEVPAELRKRALQRLWRSDPVLANLDGLVEYGEDYTAIGTAKQLVRTAYRVGRGMLQQAAEPAAADTAEASEQAPEEATAEAPAAEPAGDGETGAADDLTTT
jgi:hypothetical protein